MATRKTRACTTPADGVIVAKHGQVDGDTENQSLHDLLATHGEDAGAEAGRRMDWDEVMPALDVRQRRVVHAAAEGVQGDVLAGELGVSPPRITQMKRGVAERIRGVWGTTGIADSVTVPVWRAGLRAGIERRSGRRERAF